MIPIHFGAFWRSPEVTKGQNWSFFINFVPRYHSTAFAFPIWLPNILLGYKSISDHKPYSFWYISEVTRGHQGSNLVRFHQFCASLPFHSLCFSHLAYDISLGDKSITNHNPYSSWYISEVTRGHRGSKLALFHQFCASLPLHSLSFSHLASNILLGD